MDRTLRAVLTIAGTAIIIESTTWCQERAPSTPQDSVVATPDGDPTDGGTGDSGATKADAGSGSAGPCDGRYLLTISDSSPDDACRGGGTFTLVVENGEYKAGLWGNFVDSYDPQSCHLHEGSDGPATDQLSVDFHALTCTYAKDCARSPTDRFQGSCTVTKQ